VKHHPFLLACGIGLAGWVLVSACVYAAIQAGTIGALLILGVPVVVAWLMILRGQRG
jgi:hypothetical protein